MASESNAYERFNEAKVKSLTGGNRIYCAFKHRDHFGYRPMFKIWLSSNQPINADPDDDAVWARIRAISFPKSRLGAEDKRLKRALQSKAALRGLLAWAVAGAVRWYALGSAGLPELASGVAIKAEHRSENDHVAMWLSECAVTVFDKLTEKAEALSTGHKAAAKAAHAAATKIGETLAANEQLYASYESWCKRNGVIAKKQKGLTQALKHKGFVSTPTRKVRWHPCSWHLGH